MFKKSLGQKREERQKVAAKAPKSKSTDPLEKLVASINTQLGGVGHIYMGASIRDAEYVRRSSGIPSIDYITNGGFPRGGLVEFGGEYSSGKTSAALEACATEQRGENKPIAWVALEPFSKRWARERGFFLPFSEEEAVDPNTGECKPIDSWDNATELERYRMEMAGITDPYEERTRFVLVQEERGDVALDATLSLLRSNLFSIIVVDSLGVAKSTKWLLEQEVQDAGDFPREAKMIGDYTTRCLLSLNARYDDNNQVAKDGKNRLQTTLIHLNHIGMSIGGGTGPKAKYNQQSIKGGEGNKHNHHVIVFLWKGQQHKGEVGTGDDKRPYVYAQDINCIAIKSKLGPSHMQSSYKFYQQDWGAFRMGDIDVAADVVQLGLLSGHLARSGAWLEYGDVRAQGREAFVEMVRADNGLCSRLWGDALAGLKR